MNRPPRSHLRVALLFAVGLAACGGDSEPPTQPPDPNQAPVAVGTIPAQTIIAGESVSTGVSQYFNDPDGDALTYAATSSGSDVATASMSGSTLTVAGVAPGTATVTVTATDPKGLSASQSTSVTVEAPNQAPIAVDSIPAQTVTAGESVALDVSGYFSDPDGDSLTYTAESSDDGVATATVSDSSLTVAGIAPGTATVTVTATDPDGLSASQSASVTVEAPNRAPIAVDSIPAQTVTAGESVALDVSGYFSDPDGDSLTYTAESSDDGVAAATVSDSTLTVAGVTPGTASVTVTATDPDGLSASQSASVTVEAPNRAPIAVDSIPARSVFEGDTVSIDVLAYFSDPDGDTLTYTAESSDDAVAAATVSGSVLTLVAVAPGTATTTMTASDPGGLSATREARLNVASADYVVLKGLRITSSGLVNLPGLSVTQCVPVDNLSLSGRVYTVHWSLWEVTQDTVWKAVEDTRKEGQICPYDLNSADPGEYRMVGEMSVDGLLGRYRTENTVEVAGPLLRDDFHSDASLDDWGASSRADADVVNGILKLRNTEAETRAYIYRRVVDSDTENAIPVTNWEARVRMGRERTDTRVIFWVIMDHDRFTDFRFEIGSGREVDGQDTNYRLFIWDDDFDGPGEGSWVYYEDFGYGVSGAIKDGRGQFTEMSYSIKGRRLEIKAGGRTIFRMASRLPSGFATDITHVILATSHVDREAGATSLFDWVEVNGDEKVGRMSAIAADRIGRFADRIRALADGKVEAAAGPMTEVKRER